MGHKRFAGRFFCLTLVFALAGCTRHSLAALSTLANIEPIRPSAASPASDSGASGDSPAVRPAGAAASLTATASSLSGRVIGPADGFITNNGAGIISSNAGNLIGNNAGGLIANNAAGLVSNNASGVIGGNTSGLVGDHAGGYGLLLDRNSLVPMAGATIQLRDSSANVILAGAATTDGQGSFTIDGLAIAQVKGPIEVLATLQRDGRPVTFATFATLGTVQGLVLEPATTLVSKRLEALFASKSVEAAKFDVSLIPALSLKLMPLLSDRAVAASILLEAGAASQVYDAVTHNQTVVDAVAPLVKDANLPLLLPAGAHAIGSTSNTPAGAAGPAAAAPDAGGGAIGVGGNGINPLSGGNGNSGGAGTTNPIQPNPLPVQNTPVAGAVPLALTSYDSSGAAGATITVTGTGFDPVAANNAVSFAGGFAGVVTAATTTGLTVQVPAIANTGPITVMVGGQTVVGTIAFQVVQPPTPNVQSVSLSAASPGMVVMLTGTLLNLPGTVVSFNGTPANVLAATQNSLKVIVPEGATTGRLTVSLGTAYGAAPNPFTVLPHGAVLGSYSVGPNPHGLVLDGNGNVLVGSTDGPSFMRFALDGSLIATYPVVTGPIAFALDAAGNIWSVRNSAIYEYSANGALLNTFLLPGGLFPVAMAIDQVGNCWVTGTNLAGPKPIGQVIKVDKSGVVQGTYLAVSNPHGIVIAPDQTIWVANAGGNSLSHLSATGALLGSPLVDVGPTALAFDPAQTLWSVNSVGLTVSKLGLGGGTTSFPAGPRPSALAFDASGNAWVASGPAPSSANNLYKISPTGSIVGSFAAGTNPLTAVLVDSSGVVWVLDANGAKVKQIAP
jgi:hypothetical protein